jgi:hypothetical protein
MDTSEVSDASLWALLMREPSVGTLESLNQVVAGVRRLLENRYGSDAGGRLALIEITRVLALPTDAQQDNPEVVADAIACKRSLILYALSHEPEVRAYFEIRNSSDARSPANFASDLSTRVVPFLRPRVVRSGCERPDAFVLASLVLGDMWRSEPFGTFGQAVQMCGLSDEPIVGPSVQAD